LATEPVFREQALSRRSANERRDTGVVVVGAGARIAALTTVVVSLVAVAWSILATVPIQVDGAGVLLERSGVHAVVADTTGRIVRLHVAPGAHVTAGTLVAEVAQDDTSAELSEARLAREAAMIEFDRARAALDRTRAARLAHDAGRRAAADRLVAYEREHLARLDARYAVREKLAQEGFFSQMSLLEADQQRIDARRRIDELRAPIEHSVLEARTQEADDDRRLVDLELKSAQAARRVRTLEERLARTTHVRARATGYVAGMRVQAGDVVTRESELLTLAATRTDDPAHDPLVAFVFVPVEQGSQVRPGMPARVVPTTVNKAEHGHIVGTVRTVSPLPVGVEEVGRLLGSRSLADAMLKSGPQYLLEVALERADTPTGFRWSSAGGPGIALGHGAALGARIEVRHERLAVVALPYLKQVLR